jgi:hypothetical protein
MGAKTGGANVLKGAIRVTFWGAVAKAVTAVIGAVFGTRVWSTNCFCGPRSVLFALSQPVRPSQDHLRRPTAIVLLGEHAHDTLLNQARYIR